MSDLYDQFFIDNTIWEIDKVLPQNFGFLPIKGSQSDDLLDDRPSIEVYGTDLCSDYQHIPDKSFSEDQWKNLIIIGIFLDFLLFLIIIFITVFIYINEAKHYMKDQMRFKNWGLYTSITEFLYSPMKTDIQREQSEDRSDELTYKTESSEFNKAFDFLTIQYESQLNLQNKKTRSYTEVRQKRNERKDTKKKGTKVDKNVEKKEKRKSKLKSQRRSSLGRRRSVRYSFEGGAKASLKLSNALNNLVHKFTKTNAEKKPTNDRYARRRASIYSESSLDTKTRLSETSSENLPMGRSRAYSEMNFDKSYKNRQSMFNSDSLSDFKQFSKRRRMSLTPTDYKNKLTKRKSKNSKFKKDSDTCSTPDSVISKQTKIRNAGKKRRSTKQISVISPSRKSEKLVRTRSKTMNF